MFISKGCLLAILENLSVLNQEVEELKTALDLDSTKSKAVESSNSLKNHPDKC